ncbi:tetratricopeptide repeat protein [Rhizohabitans arisaemae]|uniref:tetratricopeptide repeat protein n=1 Tax=Rhizohabitans arisaemae TaxID=2720610 RepID=UPI0024B22407|nr:tetratricopeptide repeat protein [Rhizohabitans arisaemae]
MRRQQIILCVVAAGAGAAALIGPGLLADMAEIGSDAPAPTQQAVDYIDPRPGGRLSAKDLPNLITAAQARLKNVPQDAETWARLGSAYIEQARITADPAYYPKADGALRRSLREQPEENIAALVGMGSLAAARHDFAGARDWGLKAQKISERHGPAYSVLTDAYLNLGAYKSAERALQRLLDLSPSVASYTRAAHLFELKGETTRAKEALRLAEDAAVIPSDVASVAYFSGELAWKTGRPQDALTSYDLALTILSDYAPALAGRGKARFALKQTDDAIKDYEAAVARTPHPRFLLELGEIYRSLGRPADADRQFALLKATARLFTDAGVRDDLGIARYEADHGDPAVAVRLARAEWKRRPTVDVADALGWALHRAGHSAEAMRHARYAARLGEHNAEYAYHRGEIERALDRKRDAVRSLTTSITINPYFPRAAEARESLKRLSADRR